MNAVVIKSAFKPIDRGLSGVWQTPNQSVLGATETSRKHNLHLLDGDYRRAAFPTAREKQVGKSVETGVKLFKIVVQADKRGRREKADETLFLRIIERSENGGAFIE